MAKRAMKVLVVYKSGSSIKIRCQWFKIKKTGGTLTEVAWEDPKPDPMLFGVDEVAAIYKL